MSISRWTSGLGTCALLCMQVQSTLAAELERPPVQPRETAAPAPVSLTDKAVPPGTALPYGAGYELRMRAAGPEYRAADHPASSPSQGAGGSSRGSGNGAGSGSGGRGNGGGGRGR